MSAATLKAAREAGATIYTPEDMKGCPCEETMIVFGESHLDALVVALEPRAPTPEQQQKACREWFIAEGHKHGEARGWLGIAEAAWGAGIASAAPPSVEALTKEVERLKLLSVENIMLAVDPGDGDGVEVFAKRVEDVVDVLTELSTNLEDTQLVNESLRTTNAAQAEQLAKLEAGLQQVIVLQEKYYGDGMKTHIELKYLALSLKPLLHSSIPPEPQAGAEQWIAEVLIEDPTLTLRDVEMLRDGYTAALNQRQAVKAERPKGCAYCLNPIFCGTSCETCGWREAEPLSAAQGVPEGMVRYNCTTGGMEESLDGEYVLYCDVSNLSAAPEQAEGRSAPNA